MKMKNWFVDVRFIVKALEEKEAYSLVDEFLPDVEVGSPLWYTFAEVRRGPDDAPELYYLLHSMTEAQLETRSSFLTLEEKIDYTLSLYCHDRHMVRYMIKDFLKLFEEAQSSAGSVNK